jgi:uncharacterized membrane protein YphA (DoxX/SURF4 family)
MTDKGWARMFARVMVGLIFFMAGWWKCFELTPAGHVRRYFLDGYADSWIPIFLLWAVGLAIPVLELVAGGLLIVGFRTREALVTIGFILLIVTYGHTLKEPLFSIKDHILPRGLLMLATFALPASEDLFTIDAWLLRKRSRAS